MNDWISDLLSINPYDPIWFRDHFMDSPIMDMLPPGIIPVWARSGSYDHEHHATTTPRWRQMHGYFSMASFYYLDHIMREDPGTVADIGCGENVFKRFYPSIIGFDPEIAGADAVARLDREFARENRQRFDAAFACNSLHFVGLDEFPEMLSRLSSIVRPGGVVHATANTARFLDAKPGEQEPHDHGSCVDMAMAVDRMVRSLDVDWIVVDQCYDCIYPGDVGFNNGIVGNLRIVFRV